MSIAFDVTTREDRTRSLGMYSRLFLTAVHFDHFQIKDLHAQYSRYMIIVPNSLLHTAKPLQLCIHQRRNSQTHSQLPSSSRSYPEQLGGTATDEA